jgi:aspartyl-tRNA(Asn)/glutamyl-tRNA(Gln) amidotransferase subunit A
VTAADVAHDLAFATAAEVARLVRDGEVSAREVAEATLVRIAEAGVVNAFSTVTADRAMREAAAVDRARGAGRPLGPFAGVPFAAKDLFDIEGIVTRAGAGLTANDPPAARDADLVAALSGAGALLVGALTMGEFAYDFTGENAHFGPCRNPHDLSRMSGGSSSGSAAAVAAGLVPLSLGSDTNGSLRVPASLCGIFSLKPTYGRLSRGGTYPFVDSLDHLGPMARTADDLRLAYETLLCPGPRDHGWTEGPAPAEPERLRVGILRGYFEENAGAEALARRDRAAAALAGRAELSDVRLAGAAAGRAAAYIVTNAESAAFHLPRLRQSPSSFDPDTRDRFLAGALLPAAWLVDAQRVRRWWLEELLAAFRGVDVLLAPATPCAAPRIGQRALELGGRTMPLRPTLGLLAQPFSAVGLPVVTAPVFTPGEAPIGVQLVAPPWCEGWALAAAALLAESGAAVAHRPR